MDFGIHALAHALEGLHQRGEAFQRVILALNGNNGRIGGAKHVERQQRKRRRRIENNVSKALAQRRKRGAQALQAVGAIHQRQIDGRKIDIGAHDRKQIEFGSDHAIGRIGLLGHRIVERGGQFLGIDADAAGGVALRIAIDQQGRSAGSGQAGGQIDGAGGFANPAFLVDDANDCGHERLQGIGPDAAKGRAAGMFHVKHSRAKKRIASRGRASATSFS